MPLEINRRVLELLVKNKEYMYTVITNWATETHEHYSWYGLGLHYGSKSLSLRPRGSTQISIKYYDYNYYNSNYITEKEIEKRIVKYKKP